MHAQQAAEACVPGSRRPTSKQTACGRSTLRDLPHGGNQPVVEPRVGGATRVELAFYEHPGSMDCSNIDVTGATCYEVTGTGNVREVELHNDVANGCVTLAVVDAYVGGDNDVQILNIQGAITDDTYVDVLDMSQVKGSLFDAVGPGNFRADLSMDGAIDVLDMSAVKGNLFHRLGGLPVCR